MSDFSEHLRFSKDYWSVVPTMWTMLLCLVIWVLVQWCRKWYVIRHIDGPTTIPIIGNVLEFPVSNFNLFHTLNKLCSQYGTLFKLSFFTRFFIVISEPSDVKLILGDPNSINRPIFISQNVRFFLGESLPIERDRQSKHKRKILNPLFKSHCFPVYMKVFSQNAEHLMDTLNKSADNKITDVLQFLSQYSINNVIESLIGTSGQRDQAAYDQFRQYTNRFLHLITQFMLQPWLMVPGLRLLFSAGRESAQIDSAKYQLSIFENVRKSLEISQESGLPSADVISATEQNDKTEQKESKKESEEKEVNLSTICEVMRKSDNNGKPYSYKEIVNEMIGFVTAGYEPISTAGSFVLVLLAIHKDIQEEILEELEEVFGDDSRPVTIEDLFRLQKLDRAVKETLRMFPTSPTTMRETSSKVRLSSGTVLPAGIDVIIYLYKMHRDERYFPQPESFFPDRWLPENCCGIPPYAYIPFGAGVRGCIGQKFALLELKVVVIALLRRFKITTELTMNDFKNLNIRSVFVSEKKFSLNLHKK